MMDVSEYVDLILKKKHLSRAEFASIINDVERRLGEKKTTPTNITNYLNGYFPLRPKVLAKWEVALNLKEGTLINMVAPPITKESKKELSNTIMELRKLR
jgi:transcriptional regulator with XRE-family HTH domain